MTDVWVVKDPDGDLYFDCIEIQRGRTIDSFIESYGGSWYELEAQGYTVEPMKLCPMDSVITTEEALREIHMMGQESQNQACRGNPSYSDAVTDVKRKLEAIEKDNG